IQERTLAIRQRREQEAARASEAAARRIQAAQERVADSFLRSTPAVQKFIDFTHQYAAEIALATAVLAGFAVAVKKAYDFGREGAQLEQLGEAGTKLAASFGVDMAEAVRKI